MTSGQAVLEIDPREIRAMSIKVGFDLEALSSADGCPEMDTDFVLAGFLFLEAFDKELLDCHHPT